MFTSRARSHLSRKLERLYRYAFISSRHARILSSGKCLDYYHCMTMTRSQWPCVTDPPPHGRRGGSEDGPPPPPSLTVQHGVYHTVYITVDVTGLGPPVHGLLLAIRPRESR